MQRSLFLKAKSFQEKNTFLVDDFDDFKEKIMPDVIDTYVPKDIYDKVTSAIDE